jgi:hypothetical protein
MTMSKFYDLVSGYATVILKDARSKKDCYVGPLKSLPDEYDNWTVKDFSMANDGTITFMVKAPATRA